MLVKGLKSQVSHKRRDTGDALYAQGAVTIEEGDRKHVIAEIDGPSTTHVYLEQRGRRLDVSCNCSYFDREFAPCEHIWATLRAAADQGHLSGTTGPRLLFPVEFPSEDDDFDGDLPESYHRQWSLPQRVAAERKPSWRQQLTLLKQAGAEVSRTPPSAPAGHELVYLLDVAASAMQKSLVVEVAKRTRKRNGEWTKPKKENVPAQRLASLPDETDRRILSLLSGAPSQTYSYGFYHSVTGACRYNPSSFLAATVLPILCNSGRFLLRVNNQAETFPVLHWDDGDPWQFLLHVSPAEKGRYLVQGLLRRGLEEIPLSRPTLLADGFLLSDQRIARFQDSGAFRLIEPLRGNSGIRVPAANAADLMEFLCALPCLPPLELPEELRFEEVRLAPRLKLKVLPPKKSYYLREYLRGEVSFVYEDQVIRPNHAARGIYQKDQRRLLLRDLAAEQAALARLGELGFKRSRYTQDEELELPPAKLPKAVRALIADGWEIEADGKLYRKPGHFDIDIRSGIDWFELHGSVAFGEVRASLPELLAAVKRGDNTVRLDDGTFGILPEAWLKKYGVLAGLGSANDDHLRFQKCQAGLLDALLAAQPEATCDAVFERTRAELRQFDGIAPADSPAGFQGELRGYQSDGLGWLQFLQRFGFGGCLADDMGLGKTVQVLALLEARRQVRAAGGRDAPTEPSLVVMPRSLVFNWQQEAARFAPGLRILDYTGLDRAQDNESLARHDVVLTTYGTLRRDVFWLKDLPFDYCILDEAQAIKNAGSESAKAVRLLQCRHRLALSGTPVENHLGELWSLFEFLNPGMLGTASVFRLGGQGARNPDPETRKLLAQALRPFILRRTKDQVLADLPPKLEQTLYCELEGEQRRLYNELRDYYRETLLGKIEREGLNKSKMQVLTALLRLRQAACHPGLIDKNKLDAPSAKLDMLLPQLREVLDEGHKVLVFSQFTSLLSIVRARLDEEAVVHEYLDGQTRERAARVQRFQEDPECKLFLISLKAGGLGLNLTAAEYVFLLDPWWNPAVESQAIDRTHRIGQERRVFAYRLIARDTVEEKVLQLQESKRALADAIINADNSLVRDLRREDLELLLS